MKSMEQIEDYLKLHKIELTHGRLSAIYELYQDGWSDGFDVGANSTVNAKQLSAKLNGIEYGAITRDHEDLALVNGLVIVYGASDDLMEFAGAIRGEFGSWEGATVRITKDGVLNSICAQEDQYCSVLCEHFCNTCEAAKTIKAVWNNEGIPWTYETGIPHETFDIMKGGDVYCRGIVFSMDEV